MKKLSLLLVSFSVAAILFSIESCTSDPCSKTVCVNGGTQVASGSTCNCNCPAGYSGTTCATKNQDTFINTAGAYKWSVTEHGTRSAARTYNLTITASTTDITKIYLNGMWGGSFIAPVNATISGVGAFTIARQAPDADGYYVVGSGTIAGSIITVKYTVTDERTAIVLTDDFGVVMGSPSVWTKQ